MMSARGAAPMASTSHTAMVVSIVGIDGCGKTSTFEATLGVLANEVSIVGVGDRVLAGRPGEPLHEQTDIYRAKLTGAIGRVAKALRTPVLYKNVKFLDLTERTRLVDHARKHDAPVVILCDGDPLINTAAWAVARFARERLATDDALDEGLALLTGEQKVRLRTLFRELRRSWQLTLLNRLQLGRFAYPDLVVFLRIDPRLALDRIRTRGRRLQAHETEAFLRELDHAYGRVCALLERRRGLPVLHLQVNDLSHEESVARVVATIERQLTETQKAENGDAGRGIDIVATTISGSIEDRLKVGRIGPLFQSRTTRPVRMHTAGSHSQARELAYAAVRRGGRLLVSAGGAGTFNAVLEGAHVDGRIPDDLRLAFLRKGSADLIGKVLGIPDTLPEAVEAIIGGIESGETVAADVLRIETTGPGGEPELRRLVGFGGFGVFGDIPRFTESPLIKVYKGVLGQIFGDLGPFMIGFALATVYWNVERMRNRRPRLALVLDGEEFAPETWVSVILLNGDLGHDFKLGRGLDLGSGTFRVIALRYFGLRETLRQAIACKRASVLDDPARYGAVVRTVHTLLVRPEDPDHEQLVNIDGLKLRTHGVVSVQVGGRVALVPGRPREA